MSTAGGPWYRKDRAVPRHDVYSNRGWGKLNEIVRIPLVDYLAVFLLAGLIWLGLQAARWLGRPATMQLGSETRASD